MKKRKGVFILTEARSGSNWLGSLTTNAGLGRSDEWLRSDNSGMGPRTTDRDTYFETVLDKATNGTAGFCVKIFPHHLYMINHFYETDFINYCRDRYEVTMIRLTRSDSFRQAISYSRSLQTQQWTAKGEKTSKAVYDFDQICRCYFLINRSYDYWRTYTDLTQANAKHFVYEDLNIDPSPFVNFIADCFDEPHPQKMVSTMTVQRDALTEEWLLRFQAESKNMKLIQNLVPSRMPSRTPRNILRFLRKKSFKPYPYAY